ncbi:hypothetical protein D3C72_2001100 [compost metagenome]
MALTSAMRAARPTASEPEFRHMKRVNGQPPRRWPISARNAVMKRCWDRLGVMMLAITCGRDIASMTASGVWPKPSMP